MNTNAPRPPQNLFSRTRHCGQSIALVLGSGLGAFADEFASASKNPLCARFQISRKSTAIGHAGQLVVGKVEGIAVAGMQGRVHLYEGYYGEGSCFSDSRLRAHGRERR